jgi:hypothetical protein
MMAVPSTNPTNKLWSMTTIAPVKSNAWNEEEEHHLICLQTIASLEE